MTNPETWAAVLDVLLRLESKLDQEIEANAIRDQQLAVLRSRVDDDVGRQLGELAKLARDHNASLRDLRSAIRLSLDLLPVDKDDPPA
jgi:ABC-type transporter Mla subunit MlaD